MHLLSSKWTEIYLQYPGRKPPLSVTKGNYGRKQKENEPEQKFMKMEKWIRLPATSRDSPRLAALLRFTFSMTLKNTVNKNTRWTDLNSFPKPFFSQSKKKKNLFKTLLPPSSPLSRPSPLKFFRESHLLQSDRSLLFCQSSRLMAVLLYFLWIQRSPCFDPNMLIESSLLQRPSLSSYFSAANSFFLTVLLQQISASSLSFQNHRLPKPFLFFSFSFGCRTKETLIALVQNAGHFRVLHIQFLISQNDNARSVSCSLVSNKMGFGLVSIPFGLWTLFNYWAFILFGA